MTRANTGPLAGVTVVDLSQFVLGPYATQTLGDLGADIIKIEEPGGDRQRHSGKAPNSRTMGPLFVTLNRNKRSVALDLKTEPARRALRKLVARADIFIHNMRPEAVARLGFDYEAVKGMKPDIVYVEAMGYAPEGPYAGRQAFDDLVTRSAPARANMCACPCWSASPATSWPNTSMARPTCRPPALSATRPPSPPIASR